VSESYHRKGSSYRSRTGTVWTIVKRWTDAAGNVRHMIQSQGGARRDVYAYQLDEMTRIEES
jgi:hypothetical protein